MNGGGTQTTQQTNTPFNAHELNVVNQKALNLLDQPYGYYPDQTYQGPSKDYTDALSGASRTALDAARTLSGSMVGLQATAQARNNEYANGKAYEDIKPWNQGMADWSKTNYGQQGIDDLQGTASGGNRGNQFYDALYQSAGQNSTTGAQDILRQLINGGGLSNISEAVGTLGDISHGSGLRGADNIMSGYENIGNSSGNQALYSLMGGRGLGQDQLSATSSGAYLGSNPFLDAVYKNAADKVKETYQTAVQPGISSTMAKNGRFGSGAQFNQQGQAEGRLGDSLGGLASGIFAPAYEAERNRMVGAAGTLGSQQQSAAASSIENAIAALTGRSNLYNAQTGLAEDAAKNQGQLMSGLTSQQIQAANNSGQLALGDKSANTQALSAGGALYGQGVTNMTDAARILGSLGIQGHQLQQQDMQNAINNRMATDKTQLDAARADVNLANLGMQDYQAGIGAEQGSQKLGQDQLNDLIARFYGNQSSGISQLGQIAQIISGIMPSYAGNVSTTSPVQGQNPLGSLLAMLGAGAKFAPMLAA